VVDPLMFADGGTFRWKFVQCFVVA
jgi:hypothetical protein